MKFEIGLFLNSHITLSEIRCERDKRVNEFLRPLLGGDALEIRRRQIPDRLTPRLHPARAASRPDPHRLERSARIVNPVSVFAPRVVVRRPRRAGLAVKRFNLLGAFAVLRGEMRELQITVGVKAAFALALERPFHRGDVRPNVIVPKSELNMGRICNGIINLPPAVYPAARICAVRRLSGRATRKSVRIGAGGTELRKLSAHAAHEGRIATLRPFACGGPRSVISRAVDGFAKTVEKPVRYEPARAAVFALGHIHITRKISHLRGSVIAARRGLTLMNRETPLPHRLDERVFMKPPRLVGIAVRVEIIDEIFIIPRRILESERRRETASRPIGVGNPSAAVLIENRLERENGVIPVAGSAPRKVLKPRTVLEKL